MKMNIFILVLIGIYVSKVKCTCPQYSTTTTATTTTTTPKKSYGVGCSDSAECLSENGLICTSNGASCPNTYSSNVCNCRADQYYDTLQGNCAPLKSYNNSCSSSCQCQSVNSMTCQSGICSCPTGAGWFYSVTKKTCIQCPSGWTIYQGHCYYVNTNKMSWSNSLNWCRSQGADLMNLNDQNERDLLYNFYLQYANGGSLWIGAISYVAYDFRWTSDNSSLPRNSPWWCAGEPNNYGGNDNLVSEGCVFMWTRNQAVCLNDYYCTSTETFICEKEA